MNTKTITNIFFQNANNMQNPVEIQDDENLNNIREENKIQKLQQQQPNTKKRCIQVMNIPPTEVQQKRRCITWYHSDVNDNTNNLRTQLSKLQEQEQLLREELDKIVIFKDFVQDSYLSAVEAKKKVKKNKTAEDEEFEKIISVLKK